MRATAGGGHAVIKRIPTTIDYRHDITTYSEDNLYPQRVEQIMFRSPIAESAVLAKADFVSGQGFAENGDVILNEELQLTANDILKLAAKDYSPFAGFGLHFNFNALNEIYQVSPIKFEYIRFGVPNEMGKHHDVKVNINWEEDPNKLPTMMAPTFTYPLFDGKNFNFGDDLEDFSGQVMYWIIEPNVYPKSSLDAVLDSAQTNGEVQIFELSNIQNGFLGSSLFKYPGEFKSGKERQDFIGDINGMQGAENANSVTVIETPEGIIGETFMENFPANNNDRLFELTNNNTVNRITQYFGMPHTILGIMPQTGMFNQEDIINGFKYYNMRTRNDREHVLRAFNKFGELWHQGPLNFGGILENSFEVKDDEEDFDETKNTEENVGTDNNS